MAITRKSPFNGKSLFNKKPLLTKKPAREKKYVVSDPLGNKTEVILPASMSPSEVVTTLEQVRKTLAQKRPGKKQ